MLVKPFGTLELARKPHLLLRLHLGNGVDVVLVPNLHHALPQRNHAGLDAHGLELRAAKLVRAPRQLGPVDRVVDRHLAAVDLEDLRAGFLVGQRELDFPVKAAGTEERGVEDVDAVGGGEDFDAVVGGETVELVEQFQHRALDFPVPAFLAVEAFRADGVELVDEDDRGRLFFGKGEAVADELGAVADEHLNELGAGEFEEGGFCLGGAGSGEEGLAGSGGAVHQCSCWGRLS